MLIGSFLRKRKVYRNRNYRFERRTFVGVSFGPSFTSGLDPSFRTGFNFFISPPNNVLHLLNLVKIVFSVKLLYNIVEDFISHLHHFTDARRASLNFRCTKSKILFPSDRLLDKRMPSFQSISAIPRDYVIFLNHIL